MESSKKKEIRSRAEKAKELEFTSREKELEVSFLALMLGVLVMIRHSLSLVVSLCSLSTVEREQSVSS
jgi:hypothetical protein